MEGGPRERRRPEEETTRCSGGWRLVRGVEASTKGDRGSGGGTIGERKEGGGVGRRLGFVGCGWTMLQFP
jgi:hypothetical protein